ncbi:PH domain-containing protein [Myxococcaceae bacterium GXIMD 01537]
MPELLRPWFLRLLKVPPNPALPPGEVRVFRAAPGYLPYRWSLWAMRQASVLVGLIAGEWFMRSILRRVDQPLVSAGAYLLEALAWLAYFVQLPLSFFVARLDYELRWYILSDRSLRIREGVLALREKTMTFANIQQLSIRQNPLQRVFGIADVKVETAGGGASGDSGDSGSGMSEHLHEAHFRGVDDAEALRDVILERVRASRDSRPGKAGDTPVSQGAEPNAPARQGAEPSTSVRQGAGPEPGATLAAARELLAEMRALRQALPPGTGLAPRK